MLKNYLRVAVRNLRRHFGYTALNVVGLAVGIACCLFLLLYVQDELSYDRFHEDAETVFRVSAVFDEREIALTPPMVAGLLRTELPAVETSTRIQQSGGLIQVGEASFERQSIYFADSTVFDVWTHEFVLGDPATALDRPDTIVLTASAAQRYFGDANPIGEIVTRNNSAEFEVTGVMEDVPSNAHYSFDAIARLDPPGRPPMWSDANYHTYVRTRDAASAAAFPRQLEALLNRLEADGQEPWGLHAMPITDIHLYSNVEYELDTVGSIRVVTGFAIVALLILLIACINYMNLATARSAQRSEEVGLRKSIGALRTQLIGQFYGEAALMSLGGVALALVLVALGLSSFNGISGKALLFRDLASPPILGLIAGVFALVTLIAGSYPAFHLSGFQPVKALRGGSASGRGASRLRQGLVVVQFGISAVLIAGTLVVLGQLRYLSTQDLGFDKEHIVVLPLADPTLREAYPAMQDAIAQSPAIQSVAAVNQIPGELGWTSSMWGEGMGDDETFSVKGMPADAQVSDGLGLQLVAGQAFPESPPMPDSTNFLFLVNASTVRQLGWTPEEAVGRPVAVDSRRGEIRGVVDDFHFQSFHNPIEPLAIWYDPSAVFNLTVRLGPGQTEAGMDHLEAVWGQFASHRPFSYRFLDEVYDGLYRSEQTLGRIVSVFAFLAIFVACLGLFGLAAFTAQQRKKEIGVRKVLGATVPNLVGLLTKDFVALVAVAFVVAIPLAYLGMARWLEGFAYNTGLGPAPFVLAGGLLLAVALLTVSSQALRAATADPIRALRAD
ncbi:MAG: ABC transporter permease [Bacteroidota bacterium]